MSGPDSAMAAREPLLEEGWSVSVCRALAFRASVAVRLTRCSLLFDPRCRSFPYLCGPAETGTVSARARERACLTHQGRDACLAAGMGHHFAGHKMPRRAPL